MCESIDRISRRAYIGTDIEHRLDQAGVRLVAADEPVRFGGTGRRAKTATQLLTRRVKQGVAEWYVTEMLEKSWDGFEVHTEAGFNIGKPCYGYQAVHVPHPVPAKRAKGLKKTRLEPDPSQGPVVRTAFRWRVAEQLSYAVIADRLNRDLVTNPPPVPVDPAAAVGQWTYSNVRDMLTNPKHTGHMVWNRRARKGNGHNRLNPVTDWVWSPEPVHEPLVDLETFVQAQQVAGRRERSRTGAGRNRAPQTKRTYRLRSYLFCALCHRRMYGKTKRDTAYYVCAPKKAYLPPGHPPATYWIREDQLLDGVTKFLAENVFGTHRQQLLQTSLAAFDEQARQDQAQRVSALRRGITDTDTKIKNLVRSLEVVDDVDGDLVRDITTRRAELHAHRSELDRQLAAAEEEIDQAPNSGLLDQLPVTPVDLAALPDELSRRLFEALRLEIHYDHNTHTATCRITLTGTTIDTVAAATATTLTQGNPPRSTQHNHAETGSTAINQPEPGTVCVAPPAGAHTDGPASDLRVLTGRLIVEDGFSLG